MVDYGRSAMNLSPEHWIALQAIHGAVHNARIGLKYTWFGPGYISNVYFKMIANHPMFSLDNGGDLSMSACSGDGSVRNFTLGSVEGKPLKMTGW